MSFRSLEAQHSTILAWDKHKRQAWGGESGRVKLEGVKGKGKAVVATGEVS